MIEDRFLLLSANMRNDDRDDETKTVKGRRALCRIRCPLPSRPSADTGWYGPAFETPLKCHNDDDLLS
jgi:hypothetical protein